MGDGDGDLVAPKGTINACDAGIRVAGNLNLYTLQVLNADNIQVKGKSKGIPVVAAVNIGALTNASAAASQAAIAAQDVMQREHAAARQAMPSAFTVRVLGFGAERVPVDGARNGQGASNASEPYNPQGAMQVLGQMKLDKDQLDQLTPTERRDLTR